MNTHVDKTQENKSQPVSAAARQMKSSNESSFQFVDNKLPAAVAQGKLQEIANNSSKVKQLSAFQDMANNSLKPKQLISIENPEAIGFPGLLELIDEALPGLEKKLKGVLAKKLSKDNTHFKTRASAVEYIAAEGAQYVKAVEGAKAVKDRGDSTETAAAAIIGGQVNRGKFGHDVEWRMIDRATVEGIKKSVGMPLGHDSDQALFEDWDNVRKKLENSFNGLDLSRITSTPTDAFSSDTIAIAGGPIKFIEGTTELKEKDASRVRELIKLAHLLEYKPILVFSATVTPEQCKAVGVSFGIVVLHLKA